MIFGYKSFIPPSPSPSFSTSEPPMIKASLPNSSSMNPAYAANYQPSSNQDPLTSSSLASLPTIVSGTSVKTWLEQSTSPLSSSHLSHNPLKRKFRHHSWPLLSSSPHQNSLRDSPYSMTEPEHSDPRVSHLHSKTVQLRSLIADYV